MKMEFPLRDSRNENVSFSNFTYSKIDDFSELLYFTFFCSLIMFALCIVGMIGNIVNVIIFTHRSMTSSINILLTGLSLVDLFVLVISIPLFALPGLNVYGHFGRMAGLQKANLFLFYQLAVTAQTCSVWMFVLITIERYLAVCHPLRVQQCFTAFRAKLAQLTVIVFSVLYNSCRFWEYSIAYDERGTAVGYTRFLRDDPAYFLGYYAVLYLIIHFLAPFTLIAVLNFRITAAIEEANQIRARLSIVTGSGRENRIQRQTTRMIIVVTTIFAACNFLPFCLNIWEAVHSSSFNFSQHSGEWHWMAAYFTSEVSNVLVVANSAINFIIYLIYCQKYRTMFIGYFKFLPLRCTRNGQGAAGGRQFQILDNAIPLRSDYHISLDDTSGTGIRSVLQCQSELQC